MTWADKLVEIRDVLEKMITQLNKDQDYDGAFAAQEALQKVARIDDEMEVKPSEWTWQ